MNKIVAFGIAVALCAAAAGFGAYLALRPQTPAEPVVAASEVVVPPAPAPRPAAAESAPPEAAASGPTPVSASPASAARAAATTPRPAPALRPNRPEASAAADSPMAGAAAAAPPASVTPAAVDLDRPVISGNMIAGMPPDGVPASPQVAEQVAPPPPQRTFEELVVSADSVIGLRVESGLSSEVAKIEDPVEARVTRDVRVGTEVAIPSGTRVIGSVIQVERGGKMKTAARIGVRFHTLVMADGNRLSMDSEAIYREGRSPGQESAAKVGAAAVGGAILGAIIGGGKGAAIGGAVGAAGGTGAMMAGGRNPAVISAGTSVTVRLRQPVTVTIEREQFRD